MTPLSAPNLDGSSSEKKVRVCSTCHGASENFRKALLSGSEEGAMAAYSTGCVNLRAPYTIYRNEVRARAARYTRGVGTFVSPREAIYDRGSP